MTAASTYLLKLARQVTAPYAAEANAQAMIVTGSVADNTADTYSDLDMMAYYDVLPSEATLAAIREGNHGVNYTRLYDERERGVVGEAYDCQGVQCQIIHTTIAAWERDMSTILEQLDVGSPLQKALAGMLIAIPLHGEALIRRWQTRAANYPDSLARAMVEHHLHFFPLWNLQDLLATRDALLWRYQMLLEAAQNILGVLAGINRLYYSTFQFKRMRRFIANMAIAPKDLADRLERLFQTDLVTAGSELDQLVREVVELVEQHMPMVDTTRVRQRIEWRRQPWQPLNGEQL